MIYCSVLMETEDGVIVRKFPCWVLPVPLKDFHSKFWIQQKVAPVDLTTLLKFHFCEYKRSKVARNGTDFWVIFRRVLKKNASAFWCLKTAEYQVSEETSDNYLRFFASVRHFHICHFKKIGFFKKLMLDLDFLSPNYPGY